MAPDSVDKNQPSCSLKAPSVLLLVRLVLVGVGKEGGRVKDEGMMEGRVHNTGFTAANAVRCKRIYFSCCSRRRKKRRRRMLGWGRSFLGQVCLCVCVCCCCDRKTDSSCPLPQNTQVQPGHVTVWSCDSVVSSLRAAETMRGSGQ